MPPGPGRCSRSAAVTSHAVIGIASRGVEQAAVLATEAAPAPGQGVMPTNLSGHDVDQDFLYEFALTRSSLSPMMHRRLAVLDELRHAGFRRATVGVSHGLIRKCS
jgi:hypothetical protein